VPRPAPQPTAGPTPGPSPDRAVAPVRIAMWSGPRNISTALMRAWEQRGDCAVSDEPLYAHYLQATGLDHPARDAVIAAGDTDIARVARGRAGCRSGIRST
jgi:hypothetical protein